MVGAGALSQAETKLELAARCTCMHYIFIIQALGWDPSFFYHQQRPHMPRTTQGRRLHLLWVLHHLLLQHTYSYFPRIQKLIILRQSFVESGQNKPPGVVGSTLFMR